jgi:DNA polymerase III delta prime subunit
MLEEDLKKCERVFREIKDIRQKKRMNLYVAENELLYLAELALRAIIQYTNKKHANYIDLHNAVLFNQDKQIENIIYDTYEDTIAELIIHCITILKKNNINISKIIKSKLENDV